jgi:hypothetical protein
MRMILLPDYEETISVPPLSQLIDMIRAEISAAQAIRRTVLVRRVLTRFGLDQTEKDVVNDAVGALFSNRELLPIGQGLLSVTPLRAIDLSPSRVALISALPDEQLSKLFGHPVTGGLQRCLELDSATVKPELLAAGGKLLTVADYADLANAPVADQRWLKELTRRQQDVMSTGFRAEVAQDYRFYQNQKWMPANDAPNLATLWRGEDQNGNSVFVWSDKSDLFQGQGLRISNSDTTRTRFALDNSKGQSHQLSFQVKDGTPHLTINTFLPINEFKALLCYSYANESIDGVTQYAIYSDCWDLFSSLLNKQLGIEFMEVV